MNEHETYDVEVCRSHSHSLQSVRLPCPLCETEARQKAEAELIEWRECARALHAQVRDNPLAFVEIREARLKFAALSLRDKARLDELEFELAKSRCPHCRINGSVNCPEHNARMQP